MNPIKIVCQKTGLKPNDVVFLSEQGVMHHSGKFKFAFRTLKDNKEMTIEPKMLYVLIERGTLLKGLNDEARAAFFEHITCDLLEDLIDISEQ